MTDAFWKTTALEDMTQQQWESLCDGCGKCCLNKLECEDTGDIHYTNVACRLLDVDSAQCKNYPRRKYLVPDCTLLTPDTVHLFKWLPQSCAYKLVAEGKDLPSWHPLKTGDPNSTRTSGHAVSGHIISERDAGDLEDHLVDKDRFDPDIFDA